MQQAEIKPGRVSRRSSRYWPSSAHGISTPRTDADGLEAAAALCRSAGYWALPYPVAERLAAPPDLDVDGLVVVPGNRPAAALAGIDNRWAAVTLEGKRSTVMRRSPPVGRHVRPSSTCAARLDGRPGPVDVALGLVLPCWTLLGMLDRALELTIAHVARASSSASPCRPSRACSSS